MGKFDKTSRATAKPRAPQRKSGGGTLLGLFIGIVVGMGIAFGVVLYLNKAPLPFQNKYEGAPKAGEANGQTPAPLPGKPGDKPADRQHNFEFYNILEGKPQPATDPGAPRAATPEVPAVTISPPVAIKAAPGTLFFLQVGAFKNAADADNLKAKLALMGMESSVQEVSIPEKGAMHRVRVGPFHNPEEMNQARNLMSQSGVQGTVITQKE